MDWNAILEIDKKEIDVPSKNFLLIFNNLIQQHAPLKKLSNKKIKTLKKLWIIVGIVKSIDKKSKIYRKYIRAKNAAKKELFELFKTYKNSLNKITQLSKANYYSNFF